MKCGICGNTEPTYENRGTYGIDPVRVLPVRDAGDLVDHKRQQHPAEYAKSQQARKDTKAAHEAADRDYRRRRSEAGKAAGRVALYRYPYGEHAPTVRLTAAMDCYEHVEHYRYPEPEAFQEYNELQQLIVSLQAQATTALLRAFEYGSPVSQEDVDQVRAAMDAVPVEPS